MAETGCIESGATLNSEIEGQPKRVVCSQSLKLLKRTDNDVSAFIESGGVIESSEGVVNCNWSHDLCYLFRVFAQCIPSPVHHHETDLLKLAAVINRRWR